MPHAGLMDADALGPEAAALQQAKLHLRSGRRRLRQGKIAAGVVTLYDALISALQWYVYGPERRQRLRQEEGEDLNDERTLFAVLIRSGVLDGRFTYDKVDAAVERACAAELAGKELTDFDETAFLSGVDAVMVQLGVLPFDEAELPAEDPATY